MNFYKTQFYDVEEAMAEDENKLNLIRKTPQYERPLVLLKFFNK